MERLEVYEQGRIWYADYPDGFGKSITGIESQLKATTPTKVIEGEKEIAIYCWFENYEKLNQNEKDLLEVFFPNLESRVTEKTKGTNKLLSSVYSWCLSKESLRVVCPRCGGTGHYSWNQRDGTKCFKCYGHKYALPRLSKKWIALVKSERAASTCQ